MREDKDNDNDNDNDNDKPGKEKNVGKDRDKLTEKHINAFSKESAR